MCKDEDAYIVCHTNLLVIAILNLTLLRFIVGTVGGITQAPICYIIAAFPHVHWSSYLAMRSVFTGVFAVFFLAISMTTAMTMTSKDESDQILQ